MTQLRYRPIQHLKMTVWTSVDGRNLAWNSCKMAICQSTSFRDTLYFLYYKQKCSFKNLITLFWLYITRKGFKKPTFNSNYNACLIKVAFFLQNLCSTIINPFFKKLIKSQGINRKSYMHKAQNISLLASFISPEKERKTFRKINLS